MDIELDIIEVQPVAIIERADLSFEEAMRDNGVSSQPNGYLLESVEAS